MLVVAQHPLPLQQEGRIRHPRAHRATKIPASRRKVIDVKKPHAFTKRKNGPISLGGRKDHMKDQNRIHAK